MIFLEEKPILSLTLAYQTRVDLFFCTQVKPKNRYIERPLSFRMIRLDLVIIPNPIYPTGNSDGYLLHYRNFLLRFSAIISALF